MRVELDIFSGRPNPTWELTAEESAEFQRMLERLPRSGSGAVQQDLGYRGMIVTPSPARTRAGLEQLTVSNGVAIVTRPGAEESLVDMGRTLERWLLRSGQGRVDDTLLAEVEQELDRKD